MNICTDNALLKQEVKNLKKTNAKLEWQLDELKTENK
jgi:hypothetical protein